MAPGFRRNFALCAGALLGFFSVFYAGFDFVRFLSFRPIYDNLTGESRLCQDSIPWSVALWNPSVLWSLCVDLLLLTLFILQHSFLVRSPVKEAVRSVCGPLSRSFYCFTTSLALLILMRNWRVVSEAPCLWVIRELPYSIWFALFCFILHFFCWAIICSILFIFDYPELMGIKQVYYEIRGLEDPLTYKSPPTRRLLSHLRHPVCLELLLILWVLPALSLDRLLLSGTLSAYLFLAHSLDRDDSAYMWTWSNEKMQRVLNPQRGGRDPAQERKDE